MTDRQMMGMTVDMKLNLGNIITILTVVISISASYTVLRMSVDRTERDVEKLGARIDHPV